ncbi:hypothetical protein [Thermacetogenium phaeum]|uniref:hypothetical protein n=1 Tax=Thermacetogenium phaeum TaxID=85874 RepID=UPI0011D276A9|nr:hypothetical protein [Thermacetogenium phaeum]
MFRRKENIPQIEAETGLPAGGRLFLAGQHLMPAADSHPPVLCSSPALPLLPYGRQLITKVIQAMVVDLQINIIQLLSHKGPFLVFLTETYFLYVL